MPVARFDVTASTDPAVVAGTGLGHATNFASVSGLSYADYGAWTIDTSAASTAPRYVGAFAGPKPANTVKTAVPTSGSASYAGGTTGFISQNAGPGAGTLSSFFGDAALSVDFATGVVNGSITGINAFALGRANDATIGTVNNLAFSGTLGGNAVSGTVAPAGPSGTAFDVTGASGAFSGGLYGPTAQEIAGTYNLAGGANGTTMVGSFGAATAVAACDRRLKTDLRFLRRRGDGLALYSWRYRGDARRYTGPVAQDLVADPRFAAAVGSDRHGFLWVDFGMLALETAELPAMRAAGKRAIALSLAAAD